MAIPLKMPQLGESVVEGTIIRWLKAPGEAVQAYESLVEVETDKVVTEVPAPQDGVLLEIAVPAGQTARVGTVLAYLGEPSETAPTASDSGQAAVAATKEDAEGEAKPAKPARFSPVVLRLAEEHDLALEELQSLAGSGRGGRVTKKDVLRYIEERQQTPAPEANEAIRTPMPETEATEPDDSSEAEPPGLGQNVPLSSMRATIAEHMLRSVQTSPHVTSVFEIDMSRVAAYRQAHRQEFARQGLSLSYTAFFVQAAVEALRAYPLANATFGDGEIVIHPHINIGLAVAVEGGLLVPVIKQAESLSLKGLAGAINDLTRRARAKKLTPDDVQGGTFTVTNPGMQGALFGTAILHQPQAAILGVGAITKRLVVIGDGIAIRPMVYLSLTYDHRVMDGFGANTVLAAMRDFLENYRL